MATVITLGESMVVLNPAVTGPLRYVNTFTRSLAGAETNLSIGLVRQGHSVAWISRVGADEFGRYILQTVRGEGVDTSGVTVDPTAPTGVCFKEIPASGDPSVCYYRRGSAASQLSLTDLETIQFAGARLLHVTGITPALSESCRQMVLVAMEMARTAGLQVSFDPNYRRRLWSEKQALPVLRDMARRADIILPGADEGEMLTGESQPERIVAGLVGIGAKLVAVKLGPAGALVGDADGCAVVPGFPVTPVDTIGAGDAFAAAFLAGILEGRDPGESARRACAAGAMATQVIGDWEGLPDRSDLDRFVSNGTKMTR